MVDFVQDTLLAKRQETHGTFKKNAEISQLIKRIFKKYNSIPGKAEEAGYIFTNQEQLEALDMIAVKLSRILSGKANFKDHWDDIAGYAKLASDACD